MKLALASLFVFPMIAFSSSLKYGECKADPQSKNYIDGNFGAAYPKNVSFTCVYDCLGDSGRQLIKGTSVVRVTNVQDDGIKVVCQGVRVSFTGVYFKFEGVENFYAYDTGVKEIKNWAKTEVDRNNPFERERLVKLKQTLQQVASSYFYAGARDEFRYFREAGEELLAVAEGLPDSPAALDDAIHRYLRPGQSPSTTTKEGLVAGVLKNSASFRY